MVEKNLELPNSSVPFTANIFFRLLETAIKNRRRPSDNYKADTGKLTGTQLFYDLDVLTKCGGESVGEFKHLYTGSKIDQAQKNAAHKFKIGKITQRKSSIYCINGREIVDVFDNRVRNNYTAVYTQAVTLTRMYFGNACSDKNDALIQKVLFLIRNDSSIKDDQAFFICSDGSAKTKADLVGIDAIEFEAFLLGIWHFLIVSQRLQCGLKDKNKLLEKFAYEEHSINLVFSDIEITPTARSGDLDAQYQTDSSNNSTASNISKGKSVEETKDNYSTANNISEVKPEEETEDNTSTADDVQEEQLREETKANNRRRPPKQVVEQILRIIQGSVDPLDIPHRIKVRNTEGEEHIPRYDCTEELDANDKYILSHLDYLNDMMDDLYKDTPLKCAAIIESGKLPDNVITDDRDFSSILADNEITLTRNVFFTLLLEAVKTDNPKREKNKEKHLFLDLMELIGVACPEAKPDLEYLTFFDDKFRYLKAAYSAESLDDENQIKAFEDKISNDYDAVLDNMIRIRKKYFNSQKRNEMLVDALIEFICYDDSIPSTHKFVISEFGKRRLKRKLSESDEIEIDFEPFVLDVLRYVFALRNTKDAEGAQTFSTVFLQKYCFLKKDCAVFRGCIKKINEQSDRIVTLTHLE